MSVRKGGLAALVAIVAALLPSAASACSCAPNQSPRSMLAAAGGAFVGTLERIEGDEVAATDHDEHTFHYRVERSVKGPIGATIAVRAAANDGMCGLGHEIGARVGLFVYGGDRGWSSGSCSSISPERLLEAAAPLPPPSGVGPPALVVGTDLGGHRSLLLDAQGRTLSYGAGAGAVYGLDMCPGGTRVVEAIGNLPPGSDSPFLAVRQITGFAVEREIRAHDIPGTTDMPHMTSHQCRDAAATHLDVALRDTTSRVLRHKNGRWKQIWAGDARIVLADGPATALLVHSDRVERLDLDTGSVTVLHREDSIGGVTIAPSGRLLAVNAHRGDEPVRVSVIDARTGAIRARRHLVKGGAAAWLDDETLIVGFYGKDRLEFFDSRLRNVGAVDRWSYSLHVAGGRAFGVNFEPPTPIVRAVVSSGQVEQFTRLPDGPVLAIAAVPPPPPPPPPTTTSTSTTAVATTTPPVIETAPPPGAEPVAFPVMPAGRESRPWALSLLALVLLLATAGYLRLTVPASATSSAANASAGMGRPKR